MSDLIVDFPQQRYNDIIVDFPQQRCNSSVGEKRVRNTVYFAPMNELRFFERNEKMDTGKIWYSNKEVKAMRIATVQAVKDTRKISLSRPSNQVDGADALEDCVMTGIENLLTPRIIKKSKARRSQCLSAVLEEQKRQDSSGEYDPIELACVSNHYSKCSARWAHTIGMLQSDRLRVHQK